MTYVKTGDQLDAQVFPPLRWAVPGLIPEGMGLLTGAPKAGKSWAALSIALAVASGGPALGKVPTGHARPTLLMALEDGERRLQGRCRALLDGEPIPPLLHYITRIPPAHVWDEMGAWLYEHGSAAPLVILDTLGKVAPDSLPGESAYQRDYRIGSKLKAYADEHPGACVLVVHHVRKASSDDWMDSTSGTNGLNGAADFTLNLSRSRNDDAGIIRVTGRDVPESEYAVTSREGRWVLDGEVLAEAASKAQTARASAGLGDRAIEILNVVAEHPGGIGPTAVAEALDPPITAESAGTYLGRLSKAGRITKAGRGVYTPVESVESVETDEHSDVDHDRVSTLPLGSVETEQGLSPGNYTLSTVSTPDVDCSVCGYGPLDAEDAPLGRHAMCAPPPGGLTPDSPGQTDRVAAALANAQKVTQ
ncbi:AAA family ATPase [Gordonia iterans]